MRYLGVDFGLKRIGLALSEGELSSPFKVISVSGLANAVSKIIREVKEVGADKLVVGMPEGQTGKAAKKLITSLKQRGIDVEVSDETLSTQNASKLLIEMGISQKKRSSSDAMSAAIILQEYLDHLR